MRFLLVAVVIPAFVLARPELSNPFQEAEKWIEIINTNPHSTWTAGQNFDPTLPRSFTKSLLGLLGRSSNFSVPRTAPIATVKSEDLPTSFDARQKWSHCKSLQGIRDQGNCGSCWAVAAASAFADRLCIATHGKVNVHLSQEELLACCTDCCDGCDGGYIWFAWSYLEHHGIPTGGDYNSHEGCQPYSIKSCEHGNGMLPSCRKQGKVKTPNCSSTCTNKKYSKPLSKDLKRTNSTFQVPSDEESIQKEIFAYGPVEAGFEVYSDFIHYKSGVYKRDPSSRKLGGHAVKIIGWGVEKSVKYWLVQNSWNSHWGDKGLFKIIRGQDECGFESEIYGGTILNY